EHMQGMKQELMQRMDALGNGLDGRMDGMERRMDGMERQMDGMERQMDVMGKDICNIKVSLQHLYSHRVDMAGRIERLEEDAGVGQ
ncbi:MAG: hypothetical protein AAB728_00225, partial [Patescibacteria group bacterium]